MSKPDIKFDFQETGNVLFVSFDKEEGDTPGVDIHFLKKILDDTGYNKFHFNEDGLAEVIEIYKQTDACNDSIKIAERRDAVIKIFVPRDKMSAFLTIYPAEGGAPASLDTVKKLLAEKSIRHGFLPATIKSAILSGQADEVLIAQGKPVINGEDAKFTCLISNIKIRTPQVSECGNVDYRDLGEIKVVHPGEKLMRREPATLGQASKNILGETISPKPGKDTKFAKGLEGAASSAENVNLLVATATGQPIICDNGVSVENTMKVQNVDLTSGNIIFDGSVVVLGDVISGMKVKASGDISIKGMVENAELEAGGDISIKGAVVGRADKGAVKQSDDESLVCVNAKGSVSAKFVENALIHSGHKIMIQDWAVKSELVAVNEIVVGKKDAKKGQIIGGSAKSGILIKAKSIGTNTGATTRIQVGDAIDIGKEKDALGIEISKNANTLHDLQNTFKKLKNNPTNQAQEALKKALLYKRQLEETLINLRTKESTMALEQKRANNAKIIVEIAIYAGSSLHIAQYNKDIQEDLGKRIFQIKEGKIVQAAD